MNRRGFLGLFGLGAAALVLDPERLLWVPGQKTIFLPSLMTPPPLPNIGQIIAAAWEAKMRSRPMDNIFSSRALFDALEGQS